MLRSFPGEEKALNLARNIIIGVALLAVVVVACILPSPLETALHKAAYNVVSPLMELIDRSSVVWHRFQQGLGTLEELDKETSDLRAQNAALTTENTVLKDMAAENSRLREMLGFKKASQYRLLAARLVSRDPGNWWSNIQINRGYADDELLRSDLPVITARGVVGKTGAVKRDVTEVILMTNQNCKISAKIESSNEQGILVGVELVGDGNLDNGKSRCRLTYISRVAQVAIGERVFTSGLGGVFPAGLLLGTISEVPPLSPQINFGLYREVYVEPVENLSQLNEMFVVMEAPVTESSPSVPASGKN